MMSQIDVNVETNIKEERILANDGLKYKRVYIITSSTLAPTEVEEVRWYSTTIDILSPVKDKDWKEMNYNDGVKLEKLFQLFLTNNK